MNTAFALLARFETPALKLEDICEEFFGLSRDKAYQRAATNELPVPTFRVADSVKAPRMVHVDDLAKLIDERRAAERLQWERFRT
jgi:hypothetical protein